MVDGLREVERGRGQKYGGSVGGSVGGSGGMEDWCKAIVEGVVEV